MAQVDMTNVEKVKAYIAKNLQTPLHFASYLNKPDGIKYADSLDDLILQILESTERSRSINPNEVGETGTGRRRSALDIWRHVLTYKPDTTIYAVMRSLYRLGVEKNLLVGGFCTMILRRVFRRKDLYPNSNIYDLKILDEFGLIFSDWKTIGRYKKRRII